jgi:hypothetical protein
MILFVFYLAVDVSVMISGILGSWASEASSWVPSDFVPHRDLGSRKGTKRHQLVQSNQTDPVRHSQLNYNRPANHPLAVARPKSMEGKMIDA